MPGISVLLNCLPAGFLIFFLSLVVVQTHFLCKVLPYLPQNPLHPVSLTRAPPPRFLFLSLLSGLYFLVQNWLMLSLSFLDCGKLD